MILNCTASILFSLRLASVCGGSGPRATHLQLQGQHSSAQLTMAGLVVLQAAQLGFISPNGLFGAFEPGSQVNVSWTTPWPLTTLEIWRGPSQDDGSYNVDVLGGQ